MATDEYLLERIRDILNFKKVHFTEKRMFGGNAFMVDEKMLMGTFQGGLMARVEPELVESLIEKEGASQMKMRDRIMTGYLRIEPEGYDLEEDLEFWIQQCLDFNPKAKASKKKKSS